MDTKPIDAVSISVGQPMHTADLLLAKKEISEQFESVLIQMLIQRLRETDQLFAADATLNEQSMLYPELVDNPLPCLVASNKLSDLQSQTTSVQTHPHHRADFDSTADFVKNLWSSAQEAAKILGVDPKFLLAQAALETNWGKCILSMSTGESTHNLFNIKADQRWKEASTQIDALEHENGLMIKSKSNFRAYDSYQASFVDYVHFLKNNSRYKDALKHTANPQQFADQLQKASYATDTQYADKILQIYSSKRLNDLIAANGIQT
jgi:flagellar protein FlgJ